MKAFRFSLERVLDWRRRQAELEENKLRDLLAESRRIESAQLALADSRREAQACVRGGAPPKPHELWALSAYLERSAREEAALAQRRGAHEKLVAAQRQRVVESHRQCRLLEKLKETRRAEWQRDFDRELEAFAGEAYLSRWKPAP
jgi:flagellar export protein FliJ